MNSENLISLVLSKTPLWKKTDKRYHNRIIAEKLWNEISKEIGEDKIAIKKKWKGLRDTFRQELRKIALVESGNGSIDSEKCESTWPYFKPMCFLKDQVVIRKDSGNLNREKKIVSNITEENVEKLLPKSNDLLNDSASFSQTRTFSEKIDIARKTSSLPSFEHFNTFETDFSNQSQSTNEDIISRKPNKRKKHDISKKLIELECRKIDLLQKSQQEKSDEDESFFNSLLPHVKQLNPAKKMLCRLEIQKIIFDYAYGNNEGSPINSNSQY